MRTVVWFAYFWLYLLFIYPNLLKAKKYKENGDTKNLDSLVSEQVRNWSRSLLKVAGVQVEVEGLENIPNEPAVFVSNHQGNFDIPIILGYLGNPKGIVAKKEIKKIPLIRSWMEYLNCVFIDRENPRNSMEGMKKSIEHVKNGYSMVIFPEGTRSRCSSVAEFKHGAFMVATKTKAPIVPVRLEGSYKAMEANKGFIKPAKVTIKVMPPVATDSLTREEKKALPEKVRDIIVSEG